MPNHREYGPQKSDNIYYGNKWIILTDGLIQYNRILMIARTVAIHKPDRHTVIKFLLLLAVLAGYFAYLGWKFGLATGGLVSALTWCFFVLCTPVADAGFLVDFPLRLLFGIRMFVSEIAVWGMAIAINAYAMTFARAAYAKTTLSALLERIIETPWPLWSIIVISGIGTFASVHFGDRLFDAHDHRRDAGNHTTLRRVLHDIVVYGVLFALIFLGYRQLLVYLSIQITEPSI